MFHAVVTTLDTESDTQPKTTFTTYDEAPVVIVVEHPSDGLRAMLSDPMFYSRMAESFDGSDWYMHDARVND